MSDDSNNLPSGVMQFLKQEPLDKHRGASTLDIFEIELFAWYLRESELLIARMESEDLEYIHQQLNLGDSDSNDSGFVAVAYLTRRVRHSHVIYLTSLLEAVMKRACRRLTDALGNKNVPFLPKELKGDPWSTKKKALEKYAGLTISSEQWRPLQKLINIRNLLVHDNGTVDSIPMNRRNVLMATPGIRIVSDELEISEEYIARAHSNVMAFAEFLDQNISKAINQAN